MGIPLVEGPVAGGPDLGGELAVGVRLHPLGGDGVDLGVDVVGVVDDQGLDRRRLLGGAELHLAVVGEDGVFQEEQGLVGEAGDVPRGVADHVAAQDDVADQGPVLGVLRLDRVVVQLAELADVVEDRRGDDHVAVDRRVQVVVVLAVVLRERHADPGDAPEVLDQATAVAVVVVHRRGHLAEEVAVAVDQDMEEPPDVRAADVLGDDGQQVLDDQVGRILRRLDEVEEVVPVGGVLGDDQAALDAP